MTNTPDVEKKCHFMEHSIGWGGDCYCCGRCGEVFMSDKTLTTAIEEARREREEAVDAVSMTYKRIAELLSATYFYGDFAAETPNEREIQKLLEEVNLWPTNEDMIVKRSERHEALTHPNNPN